MGRKLKNFVQDNKNFVYPLVSWDYLQRFMNSQIQPLPLLMLRWRLSYSLFSALAPFNLCGDQILNLSDRRNSPRSVAQSHNIFQVSTNCSFEPAMSLSSRHLVYWWWLDTNWWIFLMMARALANKAKYIVSKLAGNLTHYIQLVCHRKLECHVSSWNWWIHQYQVNTFKPL